MVVSWTSTVNMNPWAARSFGGCADNWTIPQLSLDRKQGAPTCPPTRLTPVSQPASQASSPPSRARPRSSCPRSGNTPASSHFYVAQTPQPTDLRRVVQQREAVNTIIAAAHAAGAPVLVAVLGNNPRSSARQHIALIELGAHLRHRIYGQDWPLVEIPPTLVNLFATGDGQAGPQHLSARLAAAYGQQFDGPWEPVAYTLAHIARCLTHPDGYPGEQVRALETRARQDPRPARRKAAADGLSRPAPAAAAMNRSTRDAGNTAANVPNAGSRPAQTAAEHKYFAMVPHVVLAYCRTPHDLALWVIVMMVAGQEGECVLGVQRPRL